MKKIAIFASGTGSNFDALAQAIDDGRLKAEIQLLVCDQKHAKVIEKAEKRGISTFVFTAKEFASKADYESMIVSKLKHANVEWVILAGYMRLLGSTLLEAYPMHIINIHPSLLPAYKGKDAVEQAIEAGERQVGVSIHYVDEGMDTGELIAQEAIQLTGREQLDEVLQMVHHVEHRLYPQTLALLFAD
ncbi:phosphoribosylglycinamide formyltransferase [Ignatzschineria ureiclastica]|uniref:Phosphoribosylglycinamide formyltransferase n=1 Tax=Ignatzschineria ureiclastica TaxID=472582 RepID=A0A2U2ADZ6_9GAMM|nr:phosphoribosylglycinamide formyltransferase [Ignatzschineria ureiclastica]PWD80881.1 phosphoribosylglycinamide formyltransferase [Ignatzschineria ureiclastica]GGZ94158.1 phosphoribosylglycinamide formyltransferase [Ignatzschineria ureiclastica]